MMGRTRANRKGRLCLTSRRNVTNDFGWTKNCNCHQLAWRRKKNGRVENGVNFPTLSVGKGSRRETEPIRRTRVTRQPQFVLPHMDRAEFIVLKLLAYFRARSYHFFTCTFITESLDARLRKRKKKSHPDLLIQIFKLSVRFMLYCVTLIWYYQVSCYCECAQSSSSTENNRLRQWTPEIHQKTLLLADCDSKTFALCDVTSGTSSVSWSVLIQVFTGKNQATGAPPRPSRKWE